MDYFFQNYDKWLHFLISGMFAVWMVSFAIKKNKVLVWLVYVVCFLVALGKELVFDYLLGYGNIEFLDFVWTMILPTLGLIVSIKIIEQ